RAADALATLVPAMAAAVPPPRAEAARGRSGFDRDAHLARLAATRRAVQRGLFERRAEREAEAAEADAAATAGRHDAVHDGGGPSGRDSAPPPEPALLLFVTS
ncbi:MAG: hypothetical protein ACM3H9_07945, partial [Rhodospirillaceae bacterium]